MGDLLAINRLAAAQCGVFSRKQVREAGFGRAAVHHRIGSGLWVRHDDSVYGVGSAPETWEQRLWVAVLSRDHAVLTHLPAARLLGLATIPKSQPVILVPRGTNTRSSVARVLETDQFDLIASARIDGLAVTTMPETLLAIARDIRGSQLSDIFDEALVSGRLDLKAMSATIDREAGRRTPGTPQLRRLTSSRMPGAPSKSSTYLEAMLEQLLSDPRVPPWRREFGFALDDVASRVDVYIESARLVIEADGRNWHTRNRDMEADRRRDNALAAEGIQVMRFTYRMLKDEPEKCLAQILAVCLIRAA